MFCYKFIFKNKKQLQIRPKVFVLGEKGRGSGHGCMLSQFCQLTTVLIFVQVWAHLVFRALQLTSHFNIIYCKGRMKLPLTLDRQWSRTVKVVFVHSYGFQNNDKVKEPANKVAVLP